MIDYEAAAADAYTMYCQCVGGVSYNSDPLPTWEQQRAREDQKIPNAWVTAVTMVLDRHNP